MDLVHRARAAKTLGDMLGEGRIGAADNLNTVKSFVNDVIVFALDVAGIIAFGYILYGAFLYTTANGDDGKAESGKKTIYWAIVGIVVVAVARSVANIVKNELKN